MRTIVAVAIASALAAGIGRAQEPKPIPKDSARVSVPGCSKGYVFTVASRSVEQSR